MLDDITIDAAIVNLCVARGMTVESAARMLAMLARAHRIEPTSRRGWSPNPCGEIEMVAAEDPRIHAARRRICRIEKEITIACNGQESALSRKKWRREQGDAESIGTTLAHVLSRPSPKAETDIINDARSLLFRTGEAEYPNQSYGVPPESWDGSPGLNFTLDRNAFSVGKMRSGTIRLEGQSVGRILVVFEGAIPETAYAAMEAAIGQEASRLIDWKALGGWEPYLINTVRRSKWKDDESIEIIIEAPRLTCSKKTGEIRPQTNRWTRAAA